MMVMVDGLHFGGLLLWWLLGEEMTDFIASILSGE